MSSLQFSFNMVTALYILRVGGLFLSSSFTKEVCFVWYIASASMYMMLTFEAFFNSQYVGHYESLMCMFLNVCTAGYNLALCYI